MQGGCGWSWELGLLRAYSVPGHCEHPLITHIRGFYPKLTDKETEPPRLLPSGRPPPTPWFFRRFHWPWTQRVIALDWGHCHQLSLQRGAFQVSTGPPAQGRCHFAWLWGTIRGPCLPPCGESERQPGLRGTGGGDWRALV